MGPIIGSRDAYAYVAQGELARRGYDPSHAVVDQLPAGPLLAAVDPRWRDTRPPYGGVAVAIQKAAAAAGSPTAALVVLRVVAVVAVVVLVIVTVRMAPAVHKPLVIVAIAANPLVLIHLVAGAHLDAVAAAFLMCGIALAWEQPPAAPRHLLGVMLCTLGAMVKLPVGLGAAYLLILGFVAAGPSMTKRLRSIVADLLMVAAGIGLSVLVSGSGLGWVRNFGTPGRVRTGIAPADLLAHLDIGLSAARLIAAAAGLGLVAFLLLPRLRRSALRREWVAPTLYRLGLAVLALALLGPVLYPWYLAPALPLLALDAPSRRLLLVSSIVLTAAALPSMSPVWKALGRHPAAIVVLCVVAVALALAAITRTARTTHRHPA